MSDSVSDRELVDLLLWQMGYSVGIAEEVSRLRAYIIDNGFPVEHTDEWISGWAGAEFEHLNRRNTEDDPDLTAMVFGSELDDMNLLAKIKTIVGGPTVATHIIGYLYAHAKFTNLWGPWHEAVAYIDTRFEQVNHAN